MASCWIVVPIEQEIEGVPTEGYDPFYFPTDGGTLVFKFTDQTFTRVLSALRNGAALTYGEEAQQVVWDFLENVEFPVSVCDLVAECFANDEAFRQSVINSLMNDPAFVSQIRQGLGGGGMPAPGGDLAAGTNPTCDLDILWAQCLALVVNTNASIVDALEKIEVTTNVVELIDAASEIPFIGWAKEALGGQVALDAVQYFQEAVAEQYNAQYTTTVGGIQDQLACALFCAAKGDCELTVSRIWSVFRARLEAYITVPTISSAVDLIEFAAGVSQDNTVVVDLAFFFGWGAVATASFLFGDVFDVGIGMILELSVNDANNDWIGLCEDCGADWIVWDLGFSVPWGIITDQTENSVSIEAQQASGFWRIGIIRSGVCSEILSITTPNTEFNLYGCGEGVQTTVPPSVGDNVDRISITHTSAFTLTFTW